MSLFTRREGHSGHDPSGTLGRPSLAERPTGCSRLASVVPATWHPGAKVDDSEHLAAGAYERMVTESLDEQLTHLGDRLRGDELDPAEAARRLAQHLAPLLVSTFEAVPRKVRPRVRRSAREEAASRCLPTPPPGRCPSRADPQSVAAAARVCVHPVPHRHGRHGPGVRPALREEPAVRQELQQLAVVLDERADHVTSSTRSAPCDSNATPARSRRARWDSGVAALPHTRESDHSPATRSQSNRAPDQCCRRRP